MAIPKSASNICHAPPVDTRYGPESMIVSLIVKLSAGVAKDNFQVGFVPMTRMRQIAKGKDNSPYYICYIQRESAL